MKGGKTSRSSYQDRSSTEHFDQKVPGPVEGVTDRAALATSSVARTRTGCVSEMILMKLCLRIEE